jgi:hypothetical protein
MAINKEPWTTQRIQEWISSTGYPFEYEVAQLLFEAGITPILDLHIESTSSDKAREIDVCVDFHRRKDSNDKLRVLIECKYTRGPWLLLSGFSQYGGVFETGFFPATKDVPSFMYAQGTIPDTEQFMNAQGYFGSNVFPSNSVVEPTSSKNPVDTPYKTLMKITQAARDQVRYVDTLSLDISMMCIPCIIIDNDLYQCDWNSEQNEFRITPCDYGRIYWMGHGTRNCVLIATRSSTSTFIGQLKTMSQVLLNLWDKSQ